MLIYSFNNLWTLETQNKAITGTLQDLINKYPIIEQLVSKGRLTIGKGYLEISGGNS